MTRFLISWAPAILWAGLIFYSSSQVWDDGPVLIQINDKVAHLLLYIPLGVALAWGGRDFTRKRLSAGLVFLGALYAATDEWHQSFVPMRDPSVGDLMADMAGVVLGFLMANALLQAWQRRKCEGP
jgi:VanZ family protein